MTEDQLTKGLDLSDSIRRAKQDIERLENHEFIKSHGCTRIKTKEEADADNKIKASVRKQLTARLAALELQFKKL